MKRYLVCFIVVLCLVPLLACGVMAATTYVASGFVDGLASVGTIIPEGNYELYLGTYSTDEYVFLTSDLVIEYDSDGFCLVPVSVNGDDRWLLVDFIYEGSSHVSFGTMPNDEFKPFVTSDMYIEFVSIPGQTPILDTVSDSFYAILGWFTKINFELSAVGSLHHLMKLFVVAIAISVLLVGMKIIRVFCWR